MKKTDTAFKYFQERLDVLKLEDNEISFIEKGTFGANNVHILDISKNKLEVVPRPALASISSSISVLNLEVKNYIKKNETNHN